MKTSSKNEQTKEEREFSTKKIPFLFRKYALPGAVGLVFVGFQTIIDGLFLGNYVGPNAMAGVNLVMPLYTLVTALAIVVGIGCQTLVSISLGAGNRERANDALTTAFVALTLISVTFSLVLLLGGESLVRLLGADHVMLPYSVDYLTALAPFFPLLSLFFLGDYMVKALGKPYLSMKTLSGSVLLNVALDYLFIVELEWGVMGAGLATGIAFGCGALIILPHLFQKKASVSVGRGKIRFALLRQMMYNGSSEGISELSAGVTIFLFNRAMAHHAGAVGVAAFTTINYMLFTGITLFVGISDGIIPVISYNFGASNWSRVFKFLRFGWMVNATIGLLFFLFIWFAGEYFTSLFFGNSPEGAAALQIAANGSKICAFAFLINGINILMSSFFTSLGEAGTSVLISLMRGLFFVAFGIMVYPIWFGVDGIWLAVPVAEFITLICAVTLLRRRIAKVLRSYAIYR